MGRDKVQTRNCNQIFSHTTFHTTYQYHWIFIRIWLHTGMIPVKREHWIDGGLGAWCDLLLPGGPLRRGALNPGSPARLLTDF